LAAKELARRDKTTLGQTISALARRAFQAGAAAPTDATTTAFQVSERLATYGVKPLPARGGVVSNALIDRLRDAEGV
jgi:hypothetical protein